MSHLKFKTEVKCEPLAGSEAVANKLNNGRMLDRFSVHLDSEMADVRVIDIHHLSPVGE